MRQTATRPLPSFRVYLCETSDKIARVSGIDARSDADARKIAVQILKNQTAYSHAEVWERARFICTVRRGE